MLGKLIKYDLKALAKILAPLWGVLLVMGLIFGISIRSNLDGIGNTMIVFSLSLIHIWKCSSGSCSKCNSKSNY